MKKTTGIAALAVAVTAAAAVAIPSFSPETDQSRSLGSTETRWGTVYTTEISDGAVSATIQEIRAAIDHGGGGVAQTDIDNAISSEATIRASADAALGDRIGTEEVVREDADTALGTRIDGIEANLEWYVKYDADSNLLLGKEGGQVNITASQHPTATIAGNTDRFAMHGDLAGYIKESDHDADLAHKADLVGGKVPESQMPPGAISKNYTVDTEADLVPLTQAVINDKARVGAGPATSNSCNTHWPSNIQ